MRSKRLAGAPSVTEEYYENKSHTDPIVEDPLLGEADPLLEAVVDLVLGGAKGGAAAAAAAPRADVEDEPASWSLLFDRAAAELRRRAIARLKATAKWVNPF